MRFSLIAALAFALGVYAAPVPAAEAEAAPAADPQGYGTYSMCCFG